MADTITALFWDVGGVVLSNGWDTATRDRASQKFGIEREEFETRHAAAFPDYEKGRLTLDEYVERAVFWHPRNFSKQEFEAFMYAQSTEKPESRAVLDQLTSSRRYLLATINNEGRELNEYRIATFQLGRNFSLFFSSCYLGLRKPEEPIYRLALGVTQRRPQECVFVDDREENLEAPRRLGMHAIHFQSAPQLRADLGGLGVSATAVSASH